MNIYTLFKDRTAEGGAFLLSPEREEICSYERLHEHAGRLARGMTQLGIRPGDRVVGQIAKSPEALFLYFACLRLGAIYVPLNTAYLDDELAFFVGDADPSLIVCEPERQRLFEKIPGNRRVLTLDAQGNGSLSPLLSTDGQLDICERTDDDVAVILYTSGTTGKPKGAMISHGNLAANGLALHTAWQWQAGDIMLHALPIFHIHGLFVATHLPVLNRSPVILLPGFDPDQVINLLPHATVYMGVPTNYTRLLATGRLNRDVCSNMRLFISGSAPLLEQTFNEFRESTGVEIVERYGMTETGMNTSNPLDGTRKPTTVGPPLPGVTARIVDESGAPVGSGLPGNLEVRGDHVFKGYWQLPDKTRQEFTDDGFFKTGDVANQDEDGYISIVGRNKDMIISGGLNIYPREIEAVIDKLPGIVESAVIGLPHDDFGEGVCAVIVPEQGVTLEKQAIVGELKSRLANFKIPKWVHFVPSLPRNTMGKIQKNVLRDRFG